MKELEKLVYQALGEASMCWSQVPKGIFQSNKAVEIGEKLIKAIQALSQSEGEKERAIEEMISKYWYDTEYVYIDKSDEKKAKESRVKIKKWIDENLKPPQTK